MDYASHYIALSQTMTALTRMNDNTTADTAIEQLPNSLAMYMMSIVDCD